MALTGAETDALSGLHRLGRQSERYAESLERIAKHVRRIADALERAYPPPEEERVDS